jgi:DNA-binding NarL/FixJ family response regulator
METKRCKVIIVDSQEIVREAIGSRISQDCDVDVVAKAGDGYTALRLCRQLKPDVVVLDLTIHGPEGMETLTRLHEHCPNARVIAVSEDMSASVMFSVLSRGAVGFMSRQASGLDYVNAVRAAIADFTYVPADVLESFLAVRPGLGRSGNAFGLSSRELEILEACASGLSTKQVAANLNISVRTVETHRHSIYKKTDCRSIAELSQLLLQTTA